MIMNTCKNSLSWTVECLQQLPASRGVQILTNTDTIKHHHPYCCSSYTRSLTDLYKPCPCDTRSCVSRRSSSSDSEEASSSTVSQAGQESTALPARDAGTCEHVTATQAAAELVAVSRGRPSLTVERLIPLTAGNHLVTDAVSPPSAQTPATRTQVTSLLQTHQQTPDNEEQTS